MLRVLIAVNGFQPMHVERIGEATRGWATCVRIDEQTPPTDYQRELNEARIAIGWPSAEWVCNSQLQYFQLASVGYDAYLGHGLGEKEGLTICNLRGVLVIPVAEHAMAMMYCLARQLHRHAEDRPGQRWQRLEQYWELAGSTVCIVGLGGVGMELARRCRCQGMRVLGVSRHPETIPRDLLDEAIPWEQMPRSLAQADHVVLCFAASPENERLLDGRMLDHLKPGACFYNVARGSVVDEDALAARLISGQLRGAGLDVFQVEPQSADHPLWQLENVIVTPHAAGRSEQEFDRICDLFVENLRRFHEGEPLLNKIRL